MATENHSQIDSFVKYISCIYRSRVSYNSHSIDEPIKPEIEYDNSHTHAKARFFLIVDIRTLLL